jgi:Ca2+-binding RTX toxin-like protein
VTTTRCRNGNDTLDGGLGFNQLYGEAGNDAFVFNQQGYDGIIDFASGQDKLDLRLLGVTFDDLDTNDNFVLDDGDVSAQLTVSTFGGSLQLWHQGNSSVGVSLVGVASLQESDLLLS